MKRYLIIDDVRSVDQVMGWRLQEQGGDSLVIHLMRTYDEGFAKVFKSLMNNEPYDILFLDHDLGSAKSGYDLLNHIVDLCFDTQGNANELFDRLPKTIECVSSNPPGRANIESLVKFIDKTKKGE